MGTRVVIFMSACLQVSSGGAIGGLKQPPNSITNFNFQMPIPTACVFNLQVATTRVAALFVAGNRA